MRELESEHLAKAKTAQRLKQEEENPSRFHSAADDVPENLRTIEVEVREIYIFQQLCIEIDHQAIEYLTASYQPSLSQTEAGVAQLVNSLAPYGLTKAEKLQIVNLAPTEPVELYTVRPSCFVGRLVVDRSIDCRRA